MNLSGFKSNSSKGGGGFNEITLDDSKDKEQIFIHGQKDMHVRVKNDRYETIVNDHHTVISNNAGVDGFGLGKLLATRQISKMISSYVGENKEFERQYLAGELKLDFTPQGTLAEKLRAGGAGIPAFFTKTGVGTIVADGKEIREFDGHKYVMELALNPDVSLVKAHIADKSGNLVFRRTARNFNPNVAQAGKITVVEVEQIVETGALDPDQVHLPGIFVHRIVHVPEHENAFEFKTVRKR